MNPPSSASAHQQHATLHGAAAPCPGASPFQRFLHWWTSPAGLTAGVAGFLAGYWLMWNVELQLLWMAAMVFPGLCAQWQQAKASGICRDRALLIMLALITLTLTVGLIRHFPKAEWNYRWEYLIGALAMPPMFAALWIVCRAGRAVVLLRTCAWAGAMAATVSLVWWHQVQAVETPGARLRNPLVYGGLHPVATGTFGGFAVIALALVYIRQPSAASWWRKAGALAALAAAVLTVCLTISRGALLAVGCGMSVLILLAVAALIFPGFSSLAARRVWPVLLTVAAVVFSFLKFPGAFLPVVVEAPGQPGVILLETISADPAREFLARVDNGRSFFYQFGIDQPDTWVQQLTGAGLWEPDDELERSSQGGANHFHSLPVATYVHSGIIGCLLLLAAAAWGLTQAWRLMRQGQWECLVLLAYGGGGLIFDGQSACSLVTHPRFEPLLLWVPVVAASAIAGIRREGRGVTAGATVKFQTESRRCLPAHP